MLARLDDADTDTGPRNAATGPARTCVVTREVRPTEELIRFVVGPDQAVVPDLKRKLMRYIRHYNKAPKTVKWQ